jgi:hypothetical protein
MLFRFLYIKAGTAQVKGCPDHSGPRFASRELGAVAHPPVVDVPCTKTILDSEFTTWDVAEFGSSAPANVLAASPCIPARRPRLGVQLVLPS